MNDSCGDRVFMGILNFLIVFVLLFLGQPGLASASRDRNRRARKARAATPSPAAPTTLLGLGFPIEELALLPIGPPKTALERLANVFAYTPARFVATNGRWPQEPGYFRFKAMPEGDDLKKLLLESIQLDLTRQAEIIASDLCGFPKPGPHEKRDGERPVYKYFADDPQVSKYIRGLLDQFRPEIDERANVLCRSWAMNGFVSPDWVQKTEGSGSLAPRFRQFLPEEVLKSIEAMAPLASLPEKSPPPPMEFVQLSQPTNTKHAPPYRPDTAWGHWGFNPDIFEFFFTDPIVDTTPPISLGRRGWVASPWA